MKPGIFPGMQRAEYERIDAVNISLLIEGLRSMAHLKYAMDHGTEDTAALMLGRAIHLAVFEPADFLTGVIAKPHFEGEGSRKKTQEFMKQNEDKIILTPADYKVCEGMRDAMQRDEEIRAMLEAPGKGEISFIWQDKETGLWCKGRLDRFFGLHGYSWVLDIKSLTDARTRAVGRDVAKFNYHVKADWYLNGLEAIHPASRRFVWLAIEKEAPFEHALYEPDESSLAEGRAVWRSLLNKFAKCKQTGQWPGYPRGIEPLALPRWAYSSTPVGMEYEA